MSHGRVYSKAELYDIAFDFRDVPAECDALLKFADRYSGRAARSFLDLAAGPAAHVCEMAGRGLRSLAVDLTPEMVDLGRRKASEESVTIEYVEADIAAFSIDEPVDLAAILMGSLGTLLDNDSVLAHLGCVADALVPGGIYVIEMSHPREAFGVGEATSDDWVSERDGTTVHMIWGGDNDRFDPITQIDEVTVTLKWKQGEDSGEIIEVAPDHRIVPNELRALVTASGRFEIIAELGGWDPDLPITNQPESWRFILILRRIA
ncbi:MAG: class I SAM-dependent methyltransferase [Actinomycetota bacterium]